MWVVEVLDQSPITFTEQTLLKTCRRGGRDSDEEEGGGQEEEKVVLSSSPQEDSYQIRNIK